MEKKRALITGIAGQDGSYLADHLLNAGVEVFGVLRRNSIPENQDCRLSYLGDRVITFYGDVTDHASMVHVMSEVRPHFIYNLAAQSHVRISFDIPSYTAATNALGVLNMLECTREVVPSARFYQASSSEMFGNSVDADGFQRLTTPMRPISPYGNAKLFGFNSVRLYRKAYGLFACNGILFNHESPRRGSNFVTAKVVKTAVEISMGLATKLELGNLDSYRDWGHSSDYTRAMMLILNCDMPDDWIVATGESRSVRMMCQYVFNYLGLDYENYVAQNEKYIRPSELNLLRGDSSCIRNELGWSPQYNFEQMLDEMIEHWIKVKKQELYYASEVGRVNE